MDIDFESLTGITLRNGALSVLAKVNEATQVFMHSVLFSRTNCKLFLSSPFQKNLGVETNSFYDEYVELGDLSAGCLSLPDSCGSEGGSLSVWIYLNYCGTAGVLTSINYATPTTGVQIKCNTLSSLQ